MSRWRSNLATDVGSNAYAGEVDAIMNLPAAMQAAYAKVVAPTIIDSVGTGSVTQGQAAGVYSHNIVVSDTTGGVVVRGVATYTDGTSSTAIKACYGGPPA